MAINQVDGANIPAFLNGAPLPYTTKVDLQNASGQKPEITMNGDLIWSPGKGSSKCNLSFIIPADYQATYQSWMVDGKFVPLQVNVGSSVFSAVGKITDCSFSSSAGGSAEATLTWEGPLEKMTF